MEESSPRSSLVVPITTAESMLAGVRARITDPNGNELCSAPAKSDPAGSTDTCRTVLAPSQIPNFFSGFYPPDSLVRGFKNFKKSGAPSRFLSFRDGSWADVSPEVFGILRDGFMAGKTALEAADDGVSYMFDFLRMSQIDLSMGALRSIAWIDAEGQCFFPGVACPRLEIEIRIDKSALTLSSEYDSLKGKRDSADEHSDESSSTVSLDRPRWPGTEMLKEGDRFYKAVEELFLTGMRRFALDTVITSICKCSPSGLSGNSRLQAFQMQMQMVKATRGDAKVKFGWYGAPVKGIAGVMAHGFGQPNNGLLGPDAHGVGIHLSPPHSLYTSCVLSEADGDGERHAVLCRVIMGNPERVPAGSFQFHPSSDQFDSGVDELVNPRWYIVWSTHMNSHIHPEYVVSFKASKQPQGPWRTASPARKPAVPGLSFVKLAAEMGKALPSSRIQALEILYNQLKAGKINKEMFIRYMRSLVGDKVLTSTIKRLRGHHW